MSTRVLLSTEAKVHVFEGNIQDIYFGAIPVALVTNIYVVRNSQSYLVSSLLVYRMWFKDSNRIDIPSVRKRYLAFIP